MERPARELKAQILSAIRTVAEEMGIGLGEPGPGRGTFLRQTSYRPYHITQCGWVNWSDALIEAGFSANVLQAPISENDLLTELAALTRKIGRFPTHNHIRVATRQTAGFPSVTTFQKLGSQADRYRLLREWCLARAEHSDVLEILDQSPLTETSRFADTQVEQEPGAVLSASFAPPIIAALPDLAVGAPGIVAQCVAQGRDADIEFERRVKLAFKMLGLTLDGLGQGRGRVADDVAICLPQHWAVVFDAKVRRKGYRLLADDERKFREYIERHGDDLVHRGVTTIYFAVVSGSFTDGDIIRAREVVRTAGRATAFTLVEASALVRLVERRVAEPLDFKLDAVQRAFAQTRILSQRDVN